ncbi:hypothetical protein FOA52_014573 [Chlamydomonas sp. UWO 241]|nr:hypothetical protein FOA52_014573 [Chlamydomonas sp. UWO 241]
MGGAARQLLQVSPPPSPPTYPSPSPPAPPPPERCDVTFRVSGFDSLNAALVAQNRINVAAANGDLTRAFALIGLPGVVATSVTALGVAPGVGGLNPQVTPLPPAPPALAPKNVSKGAEIGIIVGCSVAGAAVLALLVTTIVLLFRNRANRVVTPEDPQGWYGAPPPAMYGYAPYKGAPVGPPLPPPWAMAPPAPGFQQPAVLPPLPQAAYAQQQQQQQGAPSMPAPAPAPAHLGGLPTGAPR